MLEGLPVDVLAPSALAGLAVLLVLTGRLVPRRTYEDALHDRDEWRAAHRISEAARQETTDQAKELMEHARTTEALLRALPAPRERGSR